MDTINKGEKELMDSISDKLKKMNDEQQALWIAVSVGGDPSVGFADSSPYAGEPNAEGRKTWQSEKSLHIAAWSK